MYAAIRSYSGPGASELFDVTVDPPAISEGEAILHF